jgi:hypothetical protein
MNNGILSVREHAQIFADSRMAMMIIGLMTSQRNRPLKYFSVDEFIIAIILYERPGLPRSACRSAAPLVE